MSIKKLNNALLLIASHGGQMPRKITSKQQYLYSAAQKDLNGGYSIMMLRDSERELLAEVWKFAGFRFTAIIAGMPHRWDLIYKSLCDYSTQPAPKRGKAMKVAGASRACCC